MHLSEIISFDGVYARTVIEKLNALLLDIVHERKSSGYLAIHRHGTLEAILGGNPT